jgi:hypothetical protein
MVFERSNSMTTLRPVRGRSPSTERTGSDMIRGGRKKDRRQAILKWKPLVKANYSRLDLDELWDRMDTD